MDSSASDYFGSLTDEYDSLIRRAVPRYDEMISRLVAYLPPEAESVLELGCGTGNLSVALAAAIRTARFTLVDGSEEMLETTRRRLPADRIAACLPSRFEDLDLKPGVFDLITSCISLHHVADKARLFRVLYRGLRSGGFLIFGDQMAGQTEANDRTNQEQMIEFWREPGHCTGDEIQSLFEHADAHDYHTPVLEQMRLIEDAGFRDVDCVWRNWMWGIITAKA